MEKSCTDLPQDVKRSQKLDVTDQVEYCFPSELNCEASSENL